MVKIATSISAGIVGAAGLAAGSAVAGAASAADAASGESTALTGYTEAGTPSPTHPFMMKRQAHAAWMLSLPVALMPVDIDYGSSMTTATAFPSLFERSMVAGVALLCFAGLIALIEHQKFTVATANIFLRQGSWDSLFRPTRHPTTPTPTAAPRVGPQVPTSTTWHYTRGVRTLREADRVWERSGEGNHARALALYHEAEADLTRALEAIDKEAQHINSQDHSGLSQLTPHPYEVLGKIALRKGKSSEAEAHWWRAAEIYRTQGKNLSVASLYMRVVQFRDPTDPQELPRVMDDYISAAVAYHHHGENLPKGQLQDLMFRNRDEAIDRFQALLAPILQEALRSTGGRRVYLELKGAVGRNLKSLDWQAIGVSPSPPWFDLALRIAHEPTSLFKVTLFTEIRDRMKETMEIYAKHQQELERLHPKIEALRQIQEPQVSEAVIAIMKDWANQIPALRQNHTQIRLPHERAQAELPIYESRAAFHAGKLEDPRQFNESVTTLLTGIVTALEMQPDPEAATRDTSAALVRWIEGSPGWGGTLIDLLLHHARLHPEFMWQTIGNIISAHPGWVNRWQLAQIHSWTEIEPRAKTAWDLVEAANPDITLAR